MRAALILATAILLAACAPEAPAPAETPSAEIADANAPAPNYALLSIAPQTGTWSFQADGATHAAGFGAPESEYQLVLICNHGSGAVTLTSAHELAPDQATTLNLITLDANRALPAQSFNEGLPSVTAELAGDQARDIATLLTAPQANIGIDVAGEVHVYPWSAEIAQALEGCR
ncbi:hypothetical protein [Vitreimonas flagellata]|uniref:hypothetical protein n=1 Tax=Vitreimonas flagellata TaxID=2560861 RepID=UPI0010749FB5|nr:hypothetical protein [Vitreimonas flagellata]